MIITLFNSNINIDIDINIKKREPPCVEPIFVVELVKLSWETAVLSLQPWFWKMENVWFIESRRLWMSGFELEPCYQLWEADQGRHSVLVGISIYHWSESKKKYNATFLRTYIELSKHRYIVHRKSNWHGGYPKSEKHSHGLANHGKQERAEGLAWP